RFRSANRRYQFSGVPQKSRRQDRESLAAVSTSTKLIVARRRLYQRNPENSGPQQTPHPGGGGLGKPRTVSWGANRRGSVVRRNHFGALVPRGLCSAARGNICHGNLGLRYSWLIVARVQVRRDLGVGLACCRLRLYQVAVNRRVARAERTTTG